MQLEDIIAKEMATIIKEAFVAYGKDIEARFAAIEAREPEKGERGEVGPAGKDADPSAIEKIVKSEIAKIPQPKDGKNGESIIGPQGERGSMFVSGKGFPNVDAKNGDVYLDVENGEVYQFKS